MTEAEAHATQPANEIGELLARAEAQRRAGRLDAASALCRQILQRHGEQPDALHMLAQMRLAARDPQGAENLMRRALAAAPERATLHFSLGNLLRDRGRGREAAASLRAAVRLKPDFTQAYNNLGNVLKALGELPQAVACYRRAIELDPRYALAHFNLGNAFRELKRDDEAIRCYRSALRIRPDYLDALNNLANALKDGDQLEAALACYRRALQVDPHAPEVLNNIGNLLREFNRLDEAAARYTEAIALTPQFADAHFGYSATLLTQGDYLRGWQEYEWRWKAKDFPAVRWSFTEPRWNGEPLDGSTLLVHYEQGYGDNIQLLRYLPLLCNRDGRILLELQKPLLPLARSMNLAAQIVPAGERRPHFDWVCSMMALPRIFATTRENIPGPVPYLFADPARVEHWRARLRAGEGLTVGIVWAGNPRQATEKHRGIGIDAYRPLFSVPGTRWFSLQVGPRAPDLAQLPPGTVEDLAPELTDFGETAAAVANLDLVITTDTSVAHLAGALARPAWVMLRWAPDWRWEQAGSETPWYPSLRLFRQAQRGDWAAPVAEARAALERRAAG